ncbi:MAG: preprotein translocase subunit SecE [Endozoicomonadaceae bacterium]|nr:preprotein translocase subunit SecE [Endozoicomonadaceae bacterium]
MATVINKDIKSASKSSDIVMWLCISLIVILGVWGNIYFSKVLLLYRVLALVGLGVVAILLAVQTKKGKLFWEMLKEAKREVRRVIWPTRQETMQTTLIVVVVILFIGLILWGVDSLLGYLVKSFIS